MCVLIHSSLAENKSTVSILDDIGSMFDDLADQLDAMLEWRAQPVSLWHNLRAPGEHKGTMTNNKPTYPFLIPHPWLLSLLPLSPSPWNAYLSSLPPSWFAQTRADVPQDWAEGHPGL